MFVGISVIITVYISSGSIFGVTTAGPSVEGSEGICPEQWGFLIIQFVPLIVGLFTPKTLDGIVRVVQIFEWGFALLVIFFLRNLKRYLLLRMILRQIILFPFVSHTHSCSMWFSLSLRTVGADVTGLATLVTDWCSLFITGIGCWF